MKNINEIVETSFTKSDAINMLETYRIFSNISEKQYKEGRKLIKKEFKK